MTADSRQHQARPVVAMVTDAIAPYHRGGKEQRYQEVARRLTAYAEVHVYTMNWWHGPPTTRHDGVEYHAICRHMPLYRGERRSMVQALLFAAACLRLLFARFDVLEADHMPYLQLFPLRLVSSLRRKRLVVTWHEVWDHAQWQAYLGRAGALAWWLERAAMRLPDCIVAASAPTAERLNRIVPQVPVVVAPNGVELDMVLRVAPAADAVDVVSVGRLLAHKRLDMVIDCVAVLSARGRELRCRIIGDGPERRRLMDRAVKRDVSRLIEFRHDVESAEELLSLVKAASVFVFPSEREGFGIAALEAIACGVPVITTTAPHNLARHLVARSANGVVCEPDVNALSAAVEAVLDGERTADIDDWVSELDWSTMAARIAHALTGASGVPSYDAPAASAALPVHPSPGPADPPMHPAP